MIRRQNIISCYDMVFKTYFQLKLENDFHYILCFKSDCHFNYAFLTMKFTSEPNSTPFAYESEKLNNLKIVKTCQT